MQKAIVIQTRSNDPRNSLDGTELNKHLSEGWRFVTAAPFGVSVSEGEAGAAFAAILIIIEKP